MQHHRTSQLQGNLPPTTPNIYKIGLIKTEEYIFKTGIDRLKGDYETLPNGYENLKTRLNIPPGTEFGFSFEDGVGGVESVGNPPSGVDVYSDKIAVQYVNKTASINTGYLTIKVWWLFGIQKNSGGYNLITEMFGH